jgi:hypothetical protein
MLCVDMISAAANSKPAVIVVLAMRVMAGPCVVAFQGQPPPGPSGSGCVKSTKVSA